MKTGNNMKQFVRETENCNMLKMVEWFCVRFFKDVGMSEPFIEKFECISAQSIQNICATSLYIQGGEEMLIKAVLDSMFSKCRFRNAVYQKEPYPLNKWEYRQTYFWIQDSEDFLYIEDYEKSLLQGRHEHEEFDGTPLLLMREERFVSIFQKELLSLVQEWKIPSKIVDDVQIDLLKKLKIRQLIYQKHRSDSSYGRSASLYPVFGLEAGNAYNDWRLVCEVRCENVLQFNLKHPYFQHIKELLDNNYLNDDEDRGSWEVSGMGLEEIYKVRNSFKKGKSLYTEGR